MTTQPTPAPLTPTRLHVYRELDSGPLQLHAFAPRVENFANRHALMFFFGGGWKGGTPTQLYPQASYLAGRGMHTYCAEYRTESSHGVTPFECVEDALAAWAWMVDHAESLGIDRDRIAIGGGSAGGNLATSVACRIRTAPRPAALVLFNPVIDNGPGGYGHERIGGRWREFSPMENLHAAMPPTLFMMGTCDDLLPVGTGHEFQKRLSQLGVRCDLRLYEGHKHGFHNNTGFHLTLSDVNRFMVSTGLLPGDPAT